MVLDILTSIDVIHVLSSCLQDEKALYDAADRGDVSAVRRLLASNVNINCTPYLVGAV